MARPTRNSEPRTRATVAGAQSGYTYLLLLFVVAGLGFFAARSAVVWQQLAQREREADLLAIGVEYARGLASYRRASPDGSLPASLEELVEDRRSMVIQRHIRRVYRDPFSGEPVWGLEKSGDRITGIHSLASGVPLREHELPDELGGIGAGVTSYAEWVFRPVDAAGAALQEGAVPASRAAPQ